MSGTEITGGEALVETLARNGTDTVFLIPGIQLDWAVDALARRDDIRMVVPRHEQSVSYMADGYARATGRVGVGMVVPGPGILNAGAGLATAFACSTPVVMVVGQIHGDSIGQGFGNLHELRNQSAVLSGVCKWSTLVTDRAGLTPSVNDAFGHAITGRAGPVAVEVPFDLLIARAEARDAAPIDGAPPAKPDPTALDAAVRVLEAAAFPVVYAGEDAIGARPFLKALADAGYPVVSSDDARGMVPESHPRSFTPLGGRPLFDRADAVLVVGSRFMEAMSPTPSWPQEGMTWVYVNADSAQMSPPRRPDVALVADPAMTLTALVPRLRRREHLRPEAAERVKDWARGKIAALGEIADYVGALREGLPEDGIFVNELTQVGYLARVAFAVEEPRRYIGSGYLGTLGYAYPTALGAAMGCPGQRVLVITGDGGFGWSSSELATAMRYALDVTLVVFSDGHFGNVRAIQRRVFGREAAVELTNPNFGVLAQAYGMAYRRAENPDALRAALGWSVARPGPALIEVPLGEMASPWPLLRLTAMPGTAEEDDYSGLI